MVEKRLTRSSARLARSCVRHKGTFRKLLGHTALDTIIQKRKADKRTEKRPKTVGADNNNKQPNMPHLDIILAHQPGETISIPYTNVEPIRDILNRTQPQLGFSWSTVVHDELFVNGRRIENN
ncbi:hypothetical protein BG015_005674 [Linnemannia schmuckeri]|uniref:Uncharacterized protein n=1 Tax=Linnemannia schmuckeri TaxID=64567 RepID=A0A9P5R6N5_9FUNG|nr:hypothetical protein BG015_005674 [Linnemannia schmuckeri]